MFQSRIDLLGCAPRDVDVAIACARRSAGAAPDAPRSRSLAPQCNTQVLKQLAGNYTAIVDFLGSECSALPQAPGRAWRGAPAAPPEPRRTVCGRTVEAPATAGADAPSPHAPPAALGFESVPANRTIFLPVNSEPLSRPFRPSSLSTCHRHLAPTTTASSAAGHCSSAA
jgi:hypothetical protein